MTQNVPLDFEDIAIEPFFDATQELLSGAAPNFDLALANATTLRAQPPAGGAAAGDAQTSISLAGSYRYRTSSADAGHPGGAAGTYDVWATGTANDFSGPTEDPDNTIYAIGLAIAPQSTPPATALKRKVGEVTWDGTRITGIVQLCGRSRDTAPITPTAPGRYVPAARFRRDSSLQVSITAWETEAGALLAQVLADGTMNAPGYQVAGAALASTHLADSAALARLAGPALTGAPSAPTAAVDTNTTQIATTAFVLAQAGTANPLMSGAVAVGTSKRYARADHVHPIDTSRSPLASPTFTGAVTSPSYVVSGATGQISARSASAANVIQWAAGVSTDTNDRYQMLADGTLLWGPPTGPALDTTLYRSGVNALKTDGSFEAAGGYILPVGAVGTPALRFSGDPNTGIFHPGADQIALVTNGIEGLTLTTAGNTVMGGSAIMNGPLQHDGAAVGFFARTPTGRNATPFTNDAGVGVGQYDLPVGYTMDQLAAFVMTALRHLGDVNGVGLLNTTGV